MFFSEVEGPVAERDLYNTYVVQVNKKLIEKTKKHGKFYENVLIIFLIFI